jgi:fused signal recognition particle receptor
MFRIFQKFQKGLIKTKNRLVGAVAGIFGIKVLDEQALESLEEALYGADFGVETTEEVLDAIRVAFRKDKELKGREAAQIGREVLRRILTGAEPAPIDWKSPTIICLVGINGSGKTTTAAKLCWHYQQEGKKVILGACDTFRAAANEQLRSWSERLDIPMVASQHGADAAAVAFDAYSAAENRGMDLCVLDTAGRLHNKSNLMEELAKIRRVLSKRNPEAPHHRWLVLDGSVGSNSIEQARVFHREFGITGLIITKLDGTSRGGALTAIYRELRIPVYYIGLGEQPEDLQPFSVDYYVDAIFGEIGEE